MGPLKHDETFPAASQFISLMFSWILIIPNRNINQVDKFIVLDNLRIILLDNRTFLRVIKSCYLVDMF